MNRKQLRSALYLLLVSPLVTDGAIAQPGRTPNVMDWQAKLAYDYNGRNFRAAIADSAALQKLHALDADAAQVTAQAYYLSGNKPGCVKYIQDNFNPPMPESTAQLLKRCQARTQP